MVNISRITLVFAATVLSISVQATDPAAYQIGDVADTNIFTPVALDVIDARATAALKSSEALKTPAIFESYPEAANEVRKDFVVAFAAAGADFAAALENTFHQATLTNGAIASPDFGYFLTAFDVQNRNFPVPASLAATWAQGGSAAAEEKKLLDLLLQTMSQPIRPDGKLTIALGDTVRLVPVKAPGDEPTLDDAVHSEIITATSVITLSQARAELRSQFSSDDQVFARALSALLKPNCGPDENLTQAIRARAIAGLVVDDHFDPGQMIVRRGVTIDSQTKAALDELSEKLMPGVLTQQIAAERQREQSDEEQAQRAQQQAELARQQQQQAQLAGSRAQTLAERAQAQAAFMRQQALIAQSVARETRIRNNWLAGSCAVMAAVALMILLPLLRQRRAAAITVPTVASRVEVAPAEFAPHLAQAVKEALVQELAAQRHELLSAQQAATSEIGELVRRLDQLQIPLQERLRTYEMQIQQLETELAARTEENRELLKMKIEMMRQQLESERRRVDFN